MDLGTMQASLVPRSTHQLPVSNRVGECEIQDEERERLATQDYSS